MAKPYGIDIATSTTASSTTLPEGLVIISVSNLDTTPANTITVSFEEAIAANSDASFTLNALAAETDTLSFANLGVTPRATTIYHQSAAGTPNLRVIGYIA